MSWRDHATLVERPVDKVEVIDVLNPPSSGLEKRLEAAVPTKLTPTGGLDQHDIFATMIADKAAKTAECYRHDLRMFARWLGVETVNEAVTRLVSGQASDTQGMIVKYRAYLCGGESGARPYSPGTVNRALAAIRAVVRTAYLAGLITWQVSVPGVKDTDPNSHEGTDQDTVRRVNQRLLQDLRKSEEDGDTRMAEKLARWLLMVRLVYEGGFRKGEANRIYWPDGVDLQAAKVRTRAKGKKRDQWREMPESVMRAVRLYLPHRGEGTAGSLLQGLGARKKATMLTDRSFDYAWDSLRAYTGLDVTPHGMRATAATVLLDQTGDLNAVRSFMNHASPATTVRYDRGSKRRAMDMRNRLASLSSPGEGEGEL